MSPGSITSHSFETYQRCRRHIDEHFREIDHLEGIAEACHIDAAYLCRLFRRYDHQSPYQHLMRLKMNLAAERLQRPGCLVKEVAADLGFSDAYHFSRVFKRVLGLAPAKFMRMRS